MAVYAIYHINIKKARQVPLNTDELDESLVANTELAEKILEDCLHGSIPVLKPQKDKTLTPLECSVEKKRDGVTLLLLCNEKNHKYMEKKTAEELVYHPGCYVAIDNRPGRMQMIIERTPSFDNKPDNVRDLLQVAFNRILDKYQLEMEILARQHEGEFWDMVDEQCNQHNDYIKKVSFEFPNPKMVHTVDAPIELTRKLSVLHAFTQALNAAKGTLHMEADKNEALKLDKTKKDIAQMVRLCCMNGYNIAVRFKRYGLYRFQDKIKAFGNVKEEVMKEFISGQPLLGKSIEGEFELVQLFEKFHESRDLYTDEEPTPQTRKSNR